MQEVRTSFSGVCSDCHAGHSLVSARSQVPCGMYTATAQLSKGLRPLLLDLKCPAACIPCPQKTLQTDKKDSAFFRITDTDQQIWELIIFDYRYPKIRKPGFPDFRKSGCQDFRKSGFSDFRKSGCSDFRKSGCPKFRKSGIWDLRKIRSFGDPKIRISGNPKIRIFGFPKTWTACDRKAQWTVSKVEGVEKTCYQR